MTTVPATAVPTQLDWALVEWDRERYPDYPDIVLGGYRRASTYGQRDGSRFQNTLSDLRKMALAKGFGVLFFDEGTRSGQTIAGRQQMPILLDYLRAGLLQGIVAPDIKRLTRDRTMLDGLEIAQVLQHRRGYLLTGRRLWDLRDRHDLQDYRREVFEAGEDLIAIRNLFYEGMEDRAQRVVRGESPPFFRGPASLGYRYAVCYWPKASGPNTPVWVTDETVGNGVMTARGLVIRTWVKADEAAPLIAELRTELLRQPTLGEVARALNERGVPGAWNVRGTNAGWSSKLIRQILKHPIYWGRWQWMYDPSPPEKVDLWYSFDAGLHRDFPELAYWSADEALEFRTRFLDGYSPRRSSSHAHPWIGLGACPGCGEAFTAAGLDKTLKAPIAKARCPNYASPARCALRKGILEDGIRRALDAYFPEVLDRLAGVRDRALVQLAELKTDPIRTQLDDLKRQERGMADLAAAAGEVSPELAERIRALVLQRKQLEAALAAQDHDQTAERLAVKSRALTDMLEGEPLAVYAEMTDTEKAVLWRVMLTDDEGKLHPVPIQRVTKGNGLTPATYRVLNDPLIVDRENIWMISRYLTTEPKVGGGHVCADDGQRFDDHSTWRAHMAQAHHLPMVAERCAGPHPTFACSGLERVARDQANAAAVA